MTYFCDQCGVLDCEKSAARRLLDRAKRNVMDLGGTTELRAGAELYEVVLSSLCAHVVPLGDDVVEQTTLPPNDDRGAVRIVPVSVNTDMRRRNDSSVRDEELTNTIVVVSEAIGAVLPNCVRLFHGTRRFPFYRSVLLY